MLSKEYLGKKITEAREYYSRKTGLKMTQAALANKIGVTRGYICDLEAGRIYPSVEKLQAIAKACDLTLGWFDGESIDDIPNELKKLGVEYLAVTKELKEKGLTPDDIRKIADVIQSIQRKTDRD